MLPSPRGLHIYAVGAASSPAAEIIAAKRGGPVISAATLDKCRDALPAQAPDAALIIVDVGTIVTRDLLALAASAALMPKLPLGFLYGRSASELLEGAQRFPDMPTEAPPDATQRIFSMLGKHIQFGAAQLEDGNSVGVTPNGIARLLAEPAELAMLIGHSSGMDMSVGGALLCRRPSANIGGELTTRAYPCFNGAPCARQTYGITRGEAVVALDDVGARRAIWLNCYGLIAAPGPFDPRLTTAESLRSGRAEAVITTVRASMIDSVDAMTLYYLTRRGLPFGTIANTANHLRQQRGLAADFFCFGDPETRMSSTLEPLDCSEIANRFVVTFGESSGGPRDIAVHLPRKFAASGHGIQCESGPTTAHLALVDEGTVFITNVPSCPSEIVFGVEPLANFHQRAQDLDRMNRGVEFITRFVQNAADRLGHETPGIAAMREGLDGLLKFIDAMPVPVPTAGSSVRLPRLRSVECELELRLSLLASNFVLVYLELGKRYSGFSPSTLWQHHYRSLGYTDRTSACSSCGNTVDIVAWSLRQDLDTRQTGYCHACGPVLDGRSVNEISFRVDPDMVRGGSHDIEVAISNPLCWAVPVSLVAMLPPFIPAEREPPHDIVPPALLEPRSTRRFTLRLDVPSDYPLGIHYLCGTQMVGVDVAFVRFPVMLGSS